MKDKKVKVVKKQKKSTNIKKVESFIGFSNFYRYFIKNFSHIAKILNELKSKKEWKQKDEHQKAFEKLKNKITNQLVLVLLKRKGKFQVETDISGHAIRGVLFQEQEGK